MEPARGESCPPGQRQDPAAPGDDKVPSPDQKSFHTYTNSNNPETKTDIPRVDTAPQGVENPTPLADLRRFGWGSWPMSRLTRGLSGPMSESEIFRGIYTSNNPTTKTDIPRVDTVPYGGPYKSSQRGTSQHNTTTTNIPGTYILPGNAGLAPRTEL